MNELKKDGLTPSEKYLGNLGERAFLSLWRYMNPVVWKNPNDKVKNELCDMFVVFGNHVLIFSVKDMNFNRAKFESDNEISIEWKKWYKKAITASAKQIFGAERKLRQYPDRIFTNSLCEQKIDFNCKDIKIHRICVAFGTGKLCAEFFGKGSTGSLMLDSKLKGMDEERLFAIGQPDIDKGFIHVFDDYSLDIVFQEIDTITDFVNYLTKREKFMSQDMGILTTGEEELLANYLTNMNDKNEHDFVLPVKISEDMDFVFLDEGFWKDFIKNPQYIRKKEADKISYAWDDLINHFINQGGIYDDNGYRKQDKSDLSELLKYLAEEPRIIRRELARILIDLVKNGPKDRLHAITGCFEEFPSKIYMFLLAPQPNDKNNHDYRIERQSLLTSYCKTAKLKYPNATHVIGLAVEPSDSNNPTEELLLLDVQDWTDDMQTEAMKIQSIFNASTTRTFRQTKIKEYPDE